MRNIAIGCQDELAPWMIDAMYEFRHEMFVHRLGWSLPLIQGTERDQYDHENTVYFMAHNGDGEVTACARLLPTTGSYMLPELFPELLGAAPAPNDSTTWELSRFAIDVRSTREGCVLSLSKPTLELLGSVIAFSRQRGIEQLALVTSIAIEKLLMRAGVGVQRIAPPAHIHGGRHVALFIAVAESAERNASIDLH